MLERRTIAIQDRYGERFQHCWGCGPKNDLGLTFKNLSKYRWKELY